MNHTEQFSKIMEQNAPIKREKTIPKPIQKRENMNPLQESLSRCTIDGSVLRLPSDLLPNYADVRKALLNAGAAYKRNTFVFPNDAQPYLDRLMGGESVNIKKEFQFFYTPSELAKEMVAFANLNSPDLLVLEPQAGQGHIVKEILAFEPGLCVHGYELMDVNRKVLSEIKDFILLGEDFLKAPSFPKFHRIIANPPFSKNQDIDHIRKMWEVLYDGGRIVTCSSNHWKQSGNKKETEFREWLDKIGATVEELEAGTFKESGTNISACLIIIDK